MGKTLVDLDPELIKKAMDLTRAPTKKETIRLALEELVRARQRQALKDMSGSGALDLTRSQLRRLRRRR